MENFRKNIIFIALVVASATYGLWYAWDIRWACDDIFITLRYISNWFDGKGLVYNAGENIEGYTHFLWLLMVAAAGKLGFDMMNASLWLGLLSFAGVIFLSAWRARRIGLFVPIAAIYFSFHHDMAIWATGGLETMFYALLILAVFTVRFQSNLSYLNKLLAVGLICALAVLTRPDAALLLLWFCFQELLVLLFNRTTLKQMVKYLFTLGILPLLILTPWLIWKYKFYGDVLPNTYYAKSGGLSYFSQGWDYLDSYARAYVSVYVAFLVGILGVVIGFIHRKKESLRPFGIPLYIQSLSTMLFVVLYAVYFVAKSGGDYMYARFIIPIVPLYFIPVENTLAMWGSKLPWRKFAIINSVVLLAWFSFSFAEHEFRDSLFRTPGHTKLTEKWHAKIYESHVHHKYSYPTDKYRRIGEELKPVFAGTKARVLNFGDCCLCYYAGFDFVLENFGLTDSAIARQPLTERVTMVGHEKEASWDYLQKRNIQICINGKDFTQRPFTKFVFRASQGDSVWADMLRYDVEVMETAKKNAGDQLRFIDPYDWFNQLIQDKEQFGADSVAKIYEINKGYYFDPNQHVPKVKAQEQEILDFIKK